MYSAVLDIDAYCRDFGEDIKTIDVQNKLKELSNTVFSQFASYNNETLEKILTNKSKEILKELGICEGVNDCGIS